MKTKNLAALAGAAAVLGGLAFWSSQSKQLKPATSVGKPVLPKVDLSAVAAIEYGAKDAKTVVALKDNGWCVPALFDYPADLTRLRENLLKLTDLKIGHVQRGKKLDDAAVRVDLKDAAGKPLAALRLGDKHQRNAPEGMGGGMFGGGSWPDGRYVAREGSDEVYLVKETLDAFDGDPKAWVDTQILNVPSAELTSFTLARGDAKTVLTRQDGTLKIDGLGEKEELDTSKTYGVESALGYLSFAGIADPKLTPEELGFATGAVYTAAAKDGTVYTATVGNAAADGNRYARFAVAFTPTGTNETVNAELKKKAEDLQGKLAPWTYLVAASTADNMGRTRADLVKAKEEPKAEQTPPGPATETAEPAAPQPVNE